MDIEETRDPDALKILERLNGTLPQGNVDDVELPSDSMPSEDDSVDNEEPKLYANKYKTVDDLKKGIKSIGSTLPDYIINGMTEDALEQHYQELNKEFSGKKDRKYADEQSGNKEDVGSDNPKAVSQELWDELGNTFNTTGRITGEQYDKLEALGIPSAIVDNYLDGLHAKAVEARNSIIAIAGNEEQFQVIKKWAEDNLDPEYINSIGNMPYNQMVNAIKGIKAQYDVANGNNGIRRVEGDTRTASVGSYKSMQEYLADVKDKRYGKDKLFTEKVEAKLSRSSLKI